MELSLDPNCSAPPPYLLFQKRCPSVAMQLLCLLYRSLWLDHALLHSSKELCTFHSPFQISIYITSMLLLSRIHLCNSSITQCKNIISYCSSMTFSELPLENPPIDFSNAPILLGHNAQYGGPEPMRNRRLFGRRRTVFYLNSTLCWKFLRRRVVHHRQCSS